MLRDLLVRDSTIVIDADHCGNTFLHHAASQGETTLVALLSEAAGQGFVSDFVNFQLYVFDFSSISA